MKDLIEALQIFLKYGNPEYPTDCSHDELRVMIDPNLVSQEDMDRLDELSFFWDKEEDPDGELGFISFRFGSA